MEFKGIGKLVVDPTDRKGWASPSYFRDEFAFKSLTSDVWDNYDHYGLVPTYAHPGVWRQKLPEGVTGVKPCEQITRFPRPVVGDQYVVDVDHQHQARLSFALRPPPGEEGLVEGRRSHLEFFL